MSPRRGQLLAPRRPGVVSRDPGSLSAYPGRRATTLLAAQAKLNQTKECLVVDGLLPLMSQAGAGNHLTTLRGKPQRRNTVVERQGQLKALIIPSQRIAQSSSLAMTIDEVVIMM